MFASHNRLFTLWAGMQTLLTLLSGVPHLECACHEVMMGLLPGNASARSSACCCCGSSFLGNFGGTSDRNKGKHSPCCRRSHVCSKDKGTDGVSASHQTSCHRKIVPPDAATQTSSQPANADSANLWLALIAPAIPAHWMATEILGRTGFRPEHALPPTECRHQVLRI